jgi:hypothetical protein
MHPKELTAHQRDRARFVLACQAAGKLQDADPQIRREMRAFAGEYHRGRRGRLLLRLERVRAPRSRRTRTARAARAGPLSGDDPPDESDPPRVAGSDRLRVLVRRLGGLTERRAA